jgi:hypothetical protein
LLVGDIFFAHAASLRQTFYFASREFSRVSSQLLTHVSGPDPPVDGRPVGTRTPDLVRVKDAL